jgi:hypothetical protein
MWQRLALLLLWALYLSPPALAQTVDDEFDGDSLNPKFWCDCQSDPKNGPIEFLADPSQGGEGILRITVNRDSVGGNKCRQYKPYRECPAPVRLAGLGLLGDSQQRSAAKPEMPEALGPSLVTPMPPLFAVAPQRFSYCTDEVELRAHRSREEDECIQRQELRLRQDFEHSIDSPYLYAFRFRMPSQIEDRVHAIRWVTAQWKEEPISHGYADRFGDDWAPSPFLAQRFDDGVLYVTVQDENCRCKVASAPNPDGSNPVWTDGDARYCKSTKPGDGNEKSCQANLKVQYGEQPVLSTALGSWVEMRYRVQAGREKDAAGGLPYIEVYEGDRFIVRVTGMIGYETDPKETSVTKFKIGQYRDYMPSTDAMDIDWVRVTPAY